MATTTKKLVKTQAQIDKLIKSQRKTATELCITLAKDLTAKMGADKLRGELESNSAHFETENFFDAAETIKDVPTSWCIVEVTKNGVTANNDGTDAAFSWSQLETETIVNLADCLADIHEEVQSHI